MNLGSGTRRPHDIAPVMRASWALLFAAIPILLSGCVDAATQEHVQSPEQRTAEQERRATLHAACMEERGWDVTVNADHSTSAYYPREQEAAFLKDSTECANELGFNNSDPASNEQLEALYREMEGVADCLAQNDYAPSAPPSLQAFIDAYRTSEAPWAPWDAVPKEVLPIALAVCPPPPPIY